MLVLMVSSSTDQRRGTTRPRSAPPATHPVAAERRQCNSSTSPTIATPVVERPKFAGVVLVSQRMRRLRGHPTAGAGRWRGRSLKGAGILGIDANGEQEIFRTAQPARQNSSASSFSVSVATSLGSCHAGNDRAIHHAHQVMLRRVIAASATTTTRGFGFVIS